MKRIAITVTLCLLFLLSLSACNEQKITNKNSDEKYEFEYEFYDPVFFKEGMVALGESIGIEIDENYNNVVANVENEPISTTSIIKCRVCNQNTGKGFPVYTSMALEKQVGGTYWVRLKYQPHDYSEWCVVGVKEDKEINYSTLLTMDLNDVQSELTAGDYRLVIFLGERNLYVEFKLY